MWNLWKQFLKSTILPTLLIFYILIGVVIYRRSSEKMVEKNDVKSLVGYSMEYQIAEELKHSYKCDKVTTEKKINGDDVNLEYDENLDVFFVRAFLDKRLEPYNYIRTVALVPKNLTLFCQIWRNGKISNTRKSSITPIWSDDWDKDENVPYVPALISCLDNPGIIGEPDEISFTKEPCNNSKFKIYIKKSVKKKFKFTICVKPVNFFNGIFKILKDWIFINNLLGVEKIIIYYKNLPEAFRNISNVDFVKFESHKKLYKMKLSFKAKMWLKRKLEVLAYNDCFYDNLYKTSFIIPLDIDEIIVPKIHKSFEEILKNEFLDKISSFSFKNSYFFKYYPEDVVKLPVTSNLVPSVFSRKIKSFYMSPGSESAKSIIYVPNTLTVFNHFSYHALGSSIRQIMIPANVAQLHHYRNNCDTTLIENCSKYLNSVVYDDSLYRLVNFSLLN